MCPPSNSRIHFSVGDKVEVKSEEEGFLGSYYKATIVECLENVQYVVQYKNLLEEDKSKPLTEVLLPKVLGPLPPRVRTSKFKMWQFVDAFDNDGWWYGKIIGKNGSRYTVQFHFQDEVKEYHSSRIRVHHEWSNEKWFLFG